MILWVTRDVTDRDADTNTRWTHSSSVQSLPFLLPWNIAVSRWGNDALYGSRTGVRSRWQGVVRCFTDSFRSALRRWHGNSPTTQESNICHQTLSHLCRPFPSDHNWKRFYSALICPILKLLKFSVVDRETVRALMNMWTTRHRAGGRKLFPMMLKKKRERSCMHPCILLLLLLLKISLHSW